MRRTTSMICACIGLGLVGCSEDKTPAKFKPTRLNREILSFPFEETLIDSRGREIRAVIVGKTRTEIIFQRAGETKRYRHPLAQLSKTNRDYLRRLPNEEWKPVSDFVKSLKDSIRRIDEKIDDLRAEKAKTPFAPTRNRALEREIDKLERERLALERDIKKRQKAEFGG